MVVGDRRPLHAHALRERVFRFSCAALTFVRAIFAWREPERTLCGQLARAALSIGSNLEEAPGAQSRADFVTKVSIALKEARETLFVLRVIRGVGAADGDELTRLLQEADELVAILTTIVKNTRDHRL